MLKNIFVYGAGDLLVRGSALLAVPFYTRWMGGEEYGVTGLLAVSGAMIGIVIGLGFDSAICYNLIQCRDDKKTSKELFSSGLILIALVFGFFTILASLFGSFIGLIVANDSSRSNLGVLQVVVTGLTVFNSYIGQAFRVEERIKLFSLLNVITAVCMFGSGLFACWLSAKTESVLFASSIALFGMLMLRLYNVKNLACFIWNRKLGIDLLHYGLPLIPAGLSYWVFTGSDRWIIKPYHGTSAVANYSIAANLVLVLSLVGSAFSNAWSPYIFKIWSLSKIHAAEVCNKILPVAVACFGFIAFAITCWRSFGIAVLAKSDFILAESAVSGLCISNVLALVTQITAIGISLSRKTKWLAFAALFAAIFNIGLNILLVPKFGIAGSAWSTSICYGLLNIIYIILSSRLAGISFNSDSMLPLAITFVGITSVATILDKPSYECAAYACALTVVFGLILIATMRGRIDALRVSLSKCSDHVK